MQVLITEPIITVAIDKLKKQFDVTVGKRDEYDDDETLSRAACEYDAILTMLSNPVNKKVLKAGEERLKIVANYAVGYNNIDTEAAAKYGIRIANTPDVLTESTAEIALTLLLTVARRTKEAELFLRKGKFKGWDPKSFMGLELHGAKLGIVGLGRIGMAFAKRAKACGMSVYYHNRRKVSRKTEMELEARYFEDLNEMLSKVDALSLHCPLTEHTHHLIGRRQFSQMSSHAVIINTSRGAVVDESALAEALHKHEIGGAGLDVFENEPDIHPELLSAPNTVLLPHIGSATEKSRAKMGILAADAIISVLNGNNASNLVA